MLKKSKDSSSSSTPKSKKQKKNSDPEEEISESLPPNAVDKDGNILVTAHGKTDQNYTETHTHTHIGCGECIF